MSQELQLHEVKSSRKVEAGCRDGLYVTAPRLTKVPEVVTLVARGEVITQDRNHDPIAASLQLRASIIRQRPVGSHQSSVGNVGYIFLYYIHFHDSPKKIV